MQNNQLTQIENRYALLIGVSEYADKSYGALPNTVNDVTALDMLLAQAGYTTRLLHSKQDEPAQRPVKNTILWELQGFADQAGPGDLLLIHYGGHGTLHDGMAYLTTEATRVADLPETAIALDELRAILENSAAQACVLILDACHSGIGRSASVMDPDFERHVFLEAQGIATLASCTQKQLAYEYEETGHGAFTYFLLDGLQGNAKQPNKRFITFQDISNHVTHHVKEWATSKSYEQHPNASSALIGDPALIALQSDNEQPHMNPFGNVNSIQEPERFIGRDDELRRLHNMLKYGSVSIIGDPKIGKSSLLWQIKHQWPGKVIGPIDFHSDDREDFYAMLGEDGKLSSKNWRAIRNHLREVEALILIDELGSAPGQGITLQDMKLLRSACERNAKLHVVTTSRSEPRVIMLETEQLDSPWYNFLPPLTLGLLDDEEAHLLLTAPWYDGEIPFDAEMVQQMLELTENHPCWLQQIAWHRLEALYDPSYDWWAAYEASVSALGHEP